MIQGINPKCWILALFIRDDGKRMVLGDYPYNFMESQLHFAPDNLQNTIVDVQGGDGSILVGQVRRGAKQSFDGFVGGPGVSKNETEKRRLAFLSFFQARHSYQVIYIDTNGEAMKRQKGFLVDAPGVEELYQVCPKYHVAVAFEDVNYYSYDEDASGNEIYGSNANLWLYDSINGGFPYDDIGLIWDDIGAICNDGLGGLVNVNNNSIVSVYPVWTITGLAVNPSLENLTTGQKLVYNGRISPGQKLVITMSNRTATLNGTNVLYNLTGEWLRLMPGYNQLKYLADNDNAPMSLLEWQEVIE